VIARIGTRRQDSIKVGSRQTCFLGDLPNSSCPRHVSKRLQEGVRVGFLCRFREIVSNGLVIDKIVCRIKVA
jgi:hypothetical protein